MVSGADGLPILSVASKAPNDLFGWYVSSIGDFDGDRFEDLAVTAPTSLIAEGIGPNDPGGPIPPWRGRVDLISGASGDILRSLFNPEATMDSFFGLGAVAVADQDADGVPDVLVSGVRHVSAPPPTTVEPQWWVISSGTGEALRFGMGPVGSVGCEFLNPGETADQFWASQAVAGRLVILVGNPADNHSWVLWDDPGLDNGTSPYFPGNPDSDAPLEDEPPGGGGPVMTEPCQAEHLRWTAAITRTSGALAVLALCLLAPPPGDVICAIGAFSAWAALGSV